MNMGCWPFSKTSAVDTHSAQAGSTNDGPSAAGAAPAAAAAATPHSAGPTTTYGSVVKPNPMHNTSAPAPAPAPAPARYEPPPVILPPAPAPAPLDPPRYEPPAPALESLTPEAAVLPMDAIEVYRSEGGDTEILCRGAHFVGYAARYLGRYEVVSLTLKMQLFELQNPASDFWTAVFVQMSLRHPNIAILYGVKVRYPFPEDKPSIQVLGDVLYGLSARSKALRAMLDTMGARCRLLSKIASALAYLHGLNVVHGCVSPDHVLLTEAGTPRLSNFRSAFRQTKATTGRSISIGRGVRGQAEYMDPYLLVEDNSASSATDLYSFAVLASEVLTLAPPPPPKPTASAGAATSKSITFATIPGVPADVAALLQACLVPTPADRPTPEDVFAALQAAGSRLP
ncbi:hypothetical protein EON62_02825 [archaeon]|nr:MAG: hypothetical protein EON62_02825 [archaeon]